jgi:hypothetical protein
MSRVHNVVQHRSAVAGVEAMTLFSDHSFPRHSHDQYGIGIMTSGAQRSWSVIGDVESRAGDVITVIPARCTTACLRIENQDAPHAGGAFCISIQS